MKKYDIFHLRTSEPDSHDVTGFERFELDSIYIPDENLIMGFLY